MHGDGLVHSLACRPGHRVTAGCPVNCLARLLPSPIAGWLARAVGDVVRFYREGRLGQMAGLGPRSLGEIEAGLVFAGLLIDVAVNCRRA